MENQVLKQLLHENINRCIDCQGTGYNELDSQECQPCKKILKMLEDKNV